MMSSEQELNRRVALLERRLQRMTIATVTLVSCLFVGLLTGAQPSDKNLREIKTTRLVVVDDQGTPRVVIGQDPKGFGRISRSAGITLHDKTGAERGGFATMDDGSVTLGLDAPAGVGNPMRDRIGLKVYSTGAAYVSLINNQTGIPVRMISDKSGSGGVEFLDYDLKARKVFIKRIDFKGESKTEDSLD